MSPTSLRFSSPPDDLAPESRSHDGGTGTNTGANFGTDWAFDQALVAVGGEPESDMGFVSDWALPATADARSTHR